MYFSRVETKIAKVIDDHFQCNLENQIMCGWKTWYNVGSFSKGLHKIMYFYVLKIVFSKNYESLKSEDHKKILYLQKWLWGFEENAIRM